MTDADLALALARTAAVGVAADSVREGSSPGPERNRAAETYRHARALSIALERWIAERAIARTRQEE